MLEYLKKIFNSKERLKAKTLDEILLFLEDSRNLINREEMYNEAFLRIDEMNSMIQLLMYLKKISDIRIREKLGDVLFLHVNALHGLKELLALRDTLENGSVQDFDISNIFIRLEYQKIYYKVKSAIELKLSYAEKNHRIAKKKDKEVAVKKALVDYDNIQCLIESIDESIDNKDALNQVMKQLLITKKVLLQKINLRYEKNEFFYKEEAEASLNYEFLSEKSFFEFDMPLTFIEKNYSIYQDLSQTDKGWKYISKHTPEMLDITDEEYENSTSQSLYLMGKRTDAKLALEYLDQLNQQKNYTFEQEFERCQYDQFFSINNLSNIIYLTYEYKVLYKFLESLPANYRLLFEAYFSDIKEALKKNFLHVLRIPQLACLYIVLNESDVENILIDFFLEHIDEYFPNNSNNDTYSPHTSHIDILHRCWETLHLKAFKRKDELLAKIETMLLTYIEASLEFTRLFYIIKKEQNKDINYFGKNVLEYLQQIENIALCVKLYEKPYSDDNFCRTVLLSNMHKIRKNNIDFNAMFENKYHALGFALYQNCSELLGKYDTNLWSEYPEVKEAFAKISRQNGYSTLYTSLNKLLASGKNMLVLYIVVNLKNMQRFEVEKYCTYCLKALGSLNQHKILEECFSSFEVLHYNLDFLSELGRYYLAQNDSEKLANILYKIEKIEPEFPFLIEAKLKLERMLLTQQLASSNISLESIEQCTGKEFEMLLIEKFKALGFKAKDTPTVGDYGADIILEDNNETKYIIQCKRFKSKVNLKAVQEVVAALAHFNGDIGIVITNSGFLTSAIKLAESNEVELWDGTKLMKFLNGDLSFSKIGLE